MVRAICCENTASPQGAERRVTKNMLITLIAVSVILSLCALGAVGVNHTIGVALAGTAGCLGLLNVVLISVDRCRKRDSTVATQHSEPSEPRERIHEVEAHPLDPSLFATPVIYAQPINDSLFASSQESSSDGVSSTSETESSADERTERERDALLDERVGSANGDYDSLDCSSPGERVRNTLIYREEEQMQAFRELRSLFNINSTYRYVEACDQYRDCGIPSDRARILIDDMPTNGAKIWDKLILIQGPHNPIHIQNMQRIVEKEEVKAVVRLGPIQGYSNYELTGVQMLSIEQWADFSVSRLGDIHHLILELEQIEGPIMIHCRAGVGRTGTFAACWHLYQLHKEGVEMVNPLEIVKELRAARGGMVQTEEQFQMILDFVRYLDDPR